MSLKHLVHVSVLFFVASSATALAQADIDNAVVESHDLGRGIYMLSSLGGNIGVSMGEDGVFLIDDQFAPLTKKIVAKIEELGGGSINFVINTHWHGDHTGGNENFSEIGAYIVAHENVRKRLGTKQFIKAIDAKVEPRPKEALPDITFRSDLSFYLNGENARLIHSPHGHTDGDSMIIFEDAKIIHMGDVFFNGNYPFIDTSSGGSIDGIIAAVDVALNIVDDSWKIIPGHGPLASESDLISYYDMLNSVRMRVNTRMENGETLREIVAADPLSDTNGKWGQGFITAERIITPVYESLDH